MRYSMFEENALPIEDDDDTQWQQLEDVNLQYGSTFPAYDDQKQEEHNECQ